MVLGLEPRRAGAMMLHEEGERGINVGEAGLFCGCDAL